jgi:hypothetical protein
MPTLQVIKYAVRPCIALRPLGLSVRYGQDWLLVQMKCVTRGRKFACAHPFFDASMNSASMSMNAPPARAEVVEHARIRLEVSLAPVPINSLPPILVDLVPAHLAFADM